MPVRRSTSSANPFPAAIVALGLLFQDIEVALHQLVASEPFEGGALLSALGIVQSSSSMLEVALGLFELLVTNSPETGSGADPQRSIRGLECREDARVSVLLGDLPALDPLVADTKEVARVRADVDRVLGSTDDPADQRLGALRGLHHGMGRREGASPSLLEDGLEDGQFVRRGREPVGVVGGIIKQLTSIDLLARVGVKKNGSLVASRRAINFVEGSNITLTIVDDSGNEEVDVLITGAAGGGGVGGMPVFWKTGNFTISESGVYIVDSSSAVVTATLPALAAVGSTGMRVIVKRHGSNYVDVDTNAADDFEPGSLQTIRLFTNWSALSLAGSLSGDYWYELGFYGSVT